MNALFVVCKVVKKRIGMNAYLPKYFELRELISLVTSDISINTLGFFNM